MAQLGDGEPDHDVGKKSLVIESGDRRLWSSLSCSRVNEKSKLLQFIFNISWIFCIADLRSFFNMEIENKIWQIPDNIRTKSTQQNSIFVHTLTWHREEWAMLGTDSEFDSTIPKSHTPYRWSDRISCLWIIKSENQKKIDSNKQTSQM